MPSSLAFPSLTVNVMHPFSIPTNQEGILMNQYCVTLPSGGNAIISESLLVWMFQDSLFPTSAMSQLRVTNLVKYPSDVVLHAFTECSQTLISQSTSPIFILPALFDKLVNVKQNHVWVPQLA